MSEIENLHSRIMAAMDRVARGLDGLGDPGRDQVDALTQALDAERASSAELSARLDEVQTDHDQALTQAQTQAAEAQAQASEAQAQVAEAQAQAAEAQARVAAFDLDLQRLRRANGQLTEACEALRDANTQGVGDPHLINTGMRAELDALHAARAAEIAHADEILAALTPLLDPAPAQPEEAS
ncbi:hypothetical protein [Roseobacter sp.]|uniref:hypothetical protein n=1 Tax=Roseobacter sp. TaxID=1907202 RepID=UPI0032991387